MTPSAPNSIGNEEASNPRSIAQQVAVRLGTVEGVAGVALFGSQAINAGDPQSDIDLLLLYRQSQRPSVEALRRIATELDDFHRPDLLTGFGAWGAFWNGGGTLVVEGRKQDWVYRSFEQTADTLEDMRSGRFDFQYNSNMLIFPTHHLLLMLQRAIPLYDPNGDFLKLRELTYPYPALLKQNLISFGVVESGTILYHAENKIVRDKLLEYYSARYAAVLLLLQVLHALNEEPYDLHQRALARLDDLPRCPPNARARILRVINAGSSRAELLESLADLRLIHNEVRELCGEPDRDYSIETKFHLAEHVTGLKASSAPAGSKTPSATGAPWRIAVSATFTAEPLQPTMEFWLDRLDPKGKVVFAPYSQVLQQLFDPQSLLAQNRAGVNVILTRTEDALRRLPEDSLELEDVLRVNLADQVEAMEATIGEQASPLLLVICPSSWRRHPRLEAIGATLERELALKAKEMGITTITPEEIDRLYPVVEKFDERSDREGHIPYTEEYFAALATVISRRALATRRPARDVVVVDGDATLWSGKVQDTDPLWVDIHSGRRALHDFLLGLGQDGRHLCVCSQGPKETDLATLQSHPDALLKLDQLAAFRVGPESYPAMLTSVAEELGKSLDRFIFISGSITTSQAVRKALPAIRVLLLPRDPALLGRFLAHHWLFDSNGHRA